LFVRQRWLLRRFFCGVYCVANYLIELFDVRGKQTRFSRVMIPVRIVLRGKLARDARVAINYSGGVPPVARY
jgi:hypothetical protein